MSIFKNIFGNSDSETPNTSNIDWIQLTNLSQLNEIQEVSNQKPAIIFKHSTTCSISRMALKNFEREYDLQNKVEAYFLDLLNFRTISNEIAIKFEVTHQSPQLLLIKNGKCFYNVSHDSIDAEELKEKI
jgi:bacillithiol system protein YtxJ